MGVLNSSGLHIQLLQFGPFVIETIVLPWPGSLMFIPPLYQSLNKNSTINQFQPSGIQIPIESWAFVFEPSQYHFQSELKCQRIINFKCQCNRRLTNWQSEYPFPFAPFIAVSQSFKVSSGLRQWSSYLYLYFYFSDSIFRYHWFVWHTIVKLIIKWVFIRRHYTKSFAFVWINWKFSLCC